MTQDNRAQQAASQDVAGSSTDTTRAGPGRPQRRNAEGIETKLQLLDAAAAACIEHGFDGTTLADIASRVGIRVPSIYNHYSSKTDLLVAAMRRAIDDRLDIAGPGHPAEVVTYLLHPERAGTRRLVGEVLRASSRNPDVAALLDEWQRESAAAWRPFAHNSDADATVKAFFLLIVGLSHLDDFEATPGDLASLTRTLSEAAEDLFSSPNQD